MLDDGKWIKVDSGAVWLLEFTSPGAFSINLIFNDLFLPAGAELYIFSYDGYMVYGPVTSKQNLEKGLFLTDIIKGESAVLYLYVPENEISNTRLAISRVVHGYKNIYTGLFAPGSKRNSGSCEKDVACYPEWNDESDAVAMVLLSDGESWCTGSLLNNTAQDFRSFFLTAFHCIDTDGNHSLEPTEKSNAGNWMFKFNYKKTTCDGSQVATTTIYNQDYFRAAWDTTDFALVELKDNLADNMCLSFLGWDRSGNVPTEGTTIHHPLADVMKISFDNDQLVETGFYQNTGKNFWRVNWDIGATEPVSSGSPLFDQNKRVVGQLAGGNSECGGSDMHDWYGAFYRSWTGGDSSDTQLAYWLGNGTPTLNTVRPSGSITGPDLVCTSNATFTLHGRPPGATVSWSKSKFNLVYVSGQGTDQYTVRASSNDVKSSGYVKATVTCPCGTKITLQKNLWIGRPGLPVTTPDGDPPMEVNYGSSFLVNLFDPPGADASMGIWSANGSITMTTGGTGSYCRFKATGYDYGQWHVHTSNNCGISDTYTGEVIVPGWKFGMQPNPADESVEITAEKRDYGTKGLVSDTYEVKILNDVKSTVYATGQTSEPVIQISTKTLSNGVYFVHFIAGKQTEVKQLVVSHK